MKYLFQSPFDIFFICLKDSVVGAFQFVICLLNVLIYNCNMENLLKKSDDVPRWCVCMSETFDWITLIIGNMLGIINILTLTGCVDSRNILNI